MSGVYHSLVAATGHRYRATIIQGLVSSRSFSSSLMEHPVSFGLPAVASSLPNVVVPNVQPSAVKARVRKYDLVKLSRVLSILPVTAECQF